MTDTYGDWSADQPNPPSCTGLRHSRPWLRALAGTWLAATVAGGPAVALPSASATASHAPVAVTAGAGDSEVTLSWQPPAQESGADGGYYVFEGTSPGRESGTPLNASPITGLSYLVPALTNGTTYYFTVATAIGTHLLSDGTSTEVSATPATTPGSPSGLTVTAGHSLVTLSWTAPASDGGSALTRYRVYDGTTAGFQDGTAATTSTGTSATVTRLTDGTTYYFRVAAVNAVGEGPASAEASAVVPAVTSSGSPRSSASLTTSEFTAPTGLTAAAGDTQVHLSWTAPVSDGGSPVTSYNVYRATVPGFQSSALVTSTTGTSATVTGLINGVTYYFRVAAVNAAGNESPYSAEVPASPGQAVTADLTRKTVPNQLIALLAAVSAAALAGAFTLAMTGSRLDSRARSKSRPRAPTARSADTGRTGTASRNRW